MCGRFVLATRPERLAEHFGAHLAPELGGEIEPSWNVAPSRPVLAVTLGSDGTRELGAFRWGLVPGFARDTAIGNRLINARAETLSQRPAFRAAFRRRRALVVADGFYEWRRAPGKARQPYYFSRRDGAPLAFAGLYELWRPDPKSPWLRTCTIVTTDAGPDVAPIHDRMPAILAEADQQRWLELPPEDAPGLARLLVPSASGTLVSWPVDRRVNSPRNDGPSLLAPSADAPSVAGSD